MRPDCELTRSPHEKSIGAVERTRTSTSRGLSSPTLPLVYDGACCWCRREDLNLHCLPSQRSDSTCWSTAAYRAWERWDSHPVVAMATALQAASVSQPSTFPWGGRWDLHPFTRGSRPRASTTSASATVRPDGVAPPSLGYRPSILSAEIRAGRYKKSPRLMAGSHPAVVTPHGGPNLRRDSGEARRQRIERCCPGFGVQSHPRWRRMSTTGRICTSSIELRRIVSQVYGSVACWKNRPDDWNRTSDNVVVGDVLCS